MEVQSEENPIIEKKYIVFESCLRSLLVVCSICLGVCKVAVKQVKGTLVVMTAVCSNGHNRIWYSQPLHKKMPTGNLYLAASMLFSGASATKVLRALKNIGIQTFSLRTYTKLQSAYLVPAVYKVWGTKQEALLKDRKGKTVNIGGDARCCSPGHTAKYGSYSVMDLKTKEILDVQLVQVSCSFVLFYDLLHQLGKLTYYLGLQNIFTCLVIISINDITNSINYFLNIFPPKCKGKGYIERSSCG